jgi:hypothetical membrane protein
MSTLTFKPHRRALLAPAPGSFRRLMLGAGLLAPVVYVATTVLGGLIRPGYSHVAEAISELTAAGAPNKALLDPLYTLYNLLGLVFATGVFLAIGRHTRGKARRIGHAGAAMLILGSALSLTFAVFPQDPGGLPVTFSGTVHILLAGVVAPASLLALLLLGLSARQSPRLRGYAAFTFAADAVILLAGSLTPLALAGPLGPYFGLVERSTIGAILVWTAVTAWKLLATDREAHTR